MIKAICLEGNELEGDPAQQEAALAVEQMQDEFKEAMHNYSDHIQLIRNLLSQGIKQG